jgi:hypothetical protein
VLRTTFAAEKELHAQRVSLIRRLEQSETEVKTAEKRLSDTRKSVYAVLESSLSPELASQLEKAVDQRLQASMYSQDLRDLPQE